MKKMIPQLKNQKGFTLIELIVVIAIIAILAAVLIPRFAGFSESAHKNAVTSDARNMLLSIEALNADQTPYLSITESMIDEYTGKVYFGSGGTCDNFECLPDGVSVEANVDGFCFHDTQGDDAYYATVEFADSEITVYAPDDTGYVAPPTP